MQKDSLIFEMLRSRRFKSDRNRFSVAHCPVAYRPRPSRSLHATRRPERIACVARNHRKRHGSRCPVI